MFIARLGMLLSVVLFAGCASVVQDHLYADYAASSLKEGATTSYVAITTALQKPQGEGKSGLVRAECFASNLSGVDAAKCTAERNQAVAALIIGSEEICLAHRKTIYGNEASWNIGLGTFTNLFAGAASVATHEAAKSILAALALFSNSERSLVNETVYKQMLITAVDRKIVEGRDTRMQTIYTALKQDINTYTMHEALRDVIVFHTTCSFMTGLQKALEEGSQASSAQRILRLKASLLSATNELATVSKDGSKDSKAEYAAGLATRINAINAALVSEETK